MTTAAGAIAQRPVAHSALVRLSIRAFRNLKRAELDLPSAGMALVGENGQGKTNFLEAIYYLRLLRSLRGAQDAELVTFGEAGFHLAGAIEGARAHDVTVGFDRLGRRKKITLDGREPERMADALGAFPAVIFSPRDAVLVAGAPVERRRFLDVMLGLSSRPYLLALQRYRGALSRRNAAMREMRLNHAAREACAAVWEPALAANGAIIYSARQEWADTHAAQYASLCEAIGERGDASMRYASSLDAASGDAEQALLAALEKKRPIDVKRGITHAGPHRDDLDLSLDGREVRTYGSAGQQRTAAIALRLLEATTLRAATRAEPLVLLDDPFAELDARRAARILELLSHEERGQTILAVPRAGDIPGAFTRLERWQVDAGVLTRTSE
ncbi:MAG TPA: DNA replication and repair protein RecF [Gemmatimonadaceae bacterium]|nr:DNA replication and repair protein RecF [Gemmatimonadaceae bacterium]